jgi:hypothetical protein
VIRLAGYVSAGLLKIATFSSTFDKITANFYKLLNYVSLDINWCLSFGALGHGTPITLVFHHKPEICVFPSVAIRNCWTAECHKT